MQIRASDVLGPLHPVAEPDMLGVIEEAVSASVADGTMERRLDEARAGAVAYVQSPPPVPGLRRAEVPESRLFDPSVVLDRPVVDSNGLVIHPAGTRVNPLAKASLPGKLVLFDATDPWQVDLAIDIAKGDGSAKAVLVSGSPTGFERQSGIRAYFDQHAVISNRFGIESLPAVISQEGMALRIDTHAPKPGQ